MEYQIFAEGTKIKEIRLSGTQSGLPYSSFVVLDSDYGTPLTLYIV